MFIQPVIPHICVERESQYIMLSGNRDTVEETCTTTWKAKKLSLIVWEGTPSVHMYSSEEMPNLTVITTRTNTKNAQGHIVEQKITSEIQVTNREFQNVIKITFVFNQIANRSFVPMNAETASWLELLFITKSISRLMSPEQNPEEEYITVFLTAYLNHYLAYTLGDFPPNSIFPGNLFSVVEN